MLTGMVCGLQVIAFPLTVLGAIGLVILAEAWWRSRGRYLPSTNLWFLVMMGSMVFITLSAGTRSPGDVSQFAGRGQILLTGVVDAPLIHYPDRSAITLRVDRVILDNEEQRVSGRVRFNASDPFLGSYQYGDILQIRTALRIPGGYLNPGGFHYGRYLQWQGIHTRGTVSRPEDVRKVGEQPAGLLRKIYTWREEIRQAALHSLQGAPRAIFLAMMIGETGELTQTVRDHFMAAGVTHILSISGSHLGLVAVVVFALARLAVLSLPAGWLIRLSQWVTASQIAAAVTVFPVVFYALLAGGQVATIRSLIMILVYLGAVGMRRDDHLLNTLALAAILVLLWDPAAIRDISFQLSYGSVLVMALALDCWGRGASRSPGILRRFLARGRLLVILTAAATIGTAPIVAYYFNQIGWVGLFSNLLLVPPAGMVIVPLGLFSAMGSLAFGDSGGLLLSGWIQVLYDLFYITVQAFAAFPGAQLRVPSPSIPTMIILYGMLLTVFMARRWVFSRRILQGLAVLLVLTGVVFAVARFSPVLRVTLLDVGQGDAMVLQFPDGQVMVVDAGRAMGDYDLGRMVVAPYLWDQGIHRIDYLVATHPQLDHIGGMGFLVEQFEIGEVWGNGVPVDRAFNQRFQSALSDKGLTERIITHQDAPRRIGSCGVRFLNPPFRSRGSASAADDSRRVNNLSLVISVDCGTHQFLLTGDIEARAAEQLVARQGNLRSTVIKVPHHGSRYSLETDFLEAVSPQVALISAGSRNPYGHPTPEVISAYQALGTRVYRTDQDGAILIQVRGDRLALWRASDLIFRPVYWGKRMLSEEWENWKRWWRPTPDLVLDKGGAVQ